MEEVYPLLIQVLVHLAARPFSPSSSQQPQVPISMGHSFPPAQFFFSLSWWKRWLAGCGAAGALGANLRCRACRLGSQGGGGVLARVVLLDWQGRLVAWTSDQCYCAVVSLAVDVSNHGLASADSGVHCSVSFPPAFLTVSSEQRQLTYSAAECTSTRTVILRSPGFRDTQSDE